MSAVVTLLGIEELASLPTKPVSVFEFALSTVAQGRYSGMLCRGFPRNVLSGPTAAIRKSEALQFIRESEEGWRHSDRNGHWEDDDCSDQSDYEEMFEVGQTLT